MGRPKVISRTEVEDAQSERFACPRCDSFNIAIETTMLMGRVRYVCQRCYWTEIHDPRVKRGL